MFYSACWQIEVSSIDQQCFECHEINCRSRDRFCNCRAKYMWWEINCDGTFCNQFFRSVAIWKSRTEIDQFFIPMNVRSFVAFVDNVWWELDKSAWNRLILWMPAPVSSGACRDCNITQPIFNAKRFCISFFQSETEIWSMTEGECIAGGRTCTHKTCPAGRSVYSLCDRQIKLICWSLAKILYLHVFVLLCTYLQSKRFWKWV